MTPNEHDEPVKSEELPTTDLHPYARATPGGTDDTMPDLPVMEQLPGSQSLPDPGYPEMPAPARGPADGVAPNTPPDGPPEPLAPPELLAPPEPLASAETHVPEERLRWQQPPAPREPLAPWEPAGRREPVAPQVPPSQARGPVDGPSARSWPRP